MKILILGGSGMLGHRILSTLGEAYPTYGTIRGSKPFDFPGVDKDKILCGHSGENFEKYKDTIEKLKPDLVINCIGIIKQVKESKDAITNIEINSLLPHKIASFCNEVGARFIHFSTDCVFSGKKGNYLETDLPDANDLYGRSKKLGEVESLENSLTLRTSLIGRELFYRGSLIDWFLRQDSIKGFRKAIFSGFPTFTIARILRDFVIPQKSLHGLYHMSAAPISKFDLLKLTKEVFDHEVEIAVDNEFEIDRSLDSTRFRNDFKFNVPPWEELVYDLNIDPQAYKVDSCR